jgi:hypothetical protein
LTASPLLKYPARSKIENGFQFRAHKRGFNKVVLLAAGLHWKGFGHAFDLSLLLGNPVLSGSDSSGSRANIKENGFAR